MSVPMLPSTRGLLSPRRRAVAVILVLVLGVLLFAPGPALYAQSGASAPRPDSAAQTLEAVIFTEAINGLLKSALNRDRPYVGAEPAPFAYDVGAFKSEHAALSMPSGHAARVFALASVLSASAGRWYLSAPLYAGAASVGIERVRSGDHWLTDVLVGAAIGELIGRSVAGAPSAAPSSGSGTADGSVQYRPIVSMRSVGVAVQF